MHRAAGLDLCILVCGFVEVAAKMSIQRVPGFISVKFLRINVMFKVKSL